MATLARLQTDEVEALEASGARMRPWDSKSELGDKMRKKRKKKKKKRKKIKDRVV